MRDIRKRFKRIERQESDLPCISSRSQADARQNDLTVMHEVIISGDRKSHFCQSDERAPNKNAENAESLPDPGGTQFALRRRGGEFRGPGLQTRMEDLKDPSGTSYHSNECS
jgi:hypothetical protein